MVYIPIYIYIYILYIDGLFIDGNYTMHVLKEFDLL